MPNKKPKSIKKPTNQELLKSELASFRIEGIHIDEQTANEVLRRVQATLEKTEEII